jgi:formylglycine-generating enzyme required for sulfatase activity
MKQTIRNGFALMACLAALAAPPLAAQSRGMSVVASDGSALVSFSGSYALVIGESRYTNGWPSLPGVSGDTAAVKRLLEEQGFSVETLENLSSRDMRNGIENFFNRHGYNRDVRLLIYYAGHGHTLKLDNTRDMGYIVPIDAPLPARDETGFKRLAIAMQQFDTWAKQIESRHVLFMFDSCFSGSIFAASRAALGIIDYKIANPVRQFISSGGADETVPDTSIFRRQLEAALRGREADYNKDGYVSGSELGDFLQSTVVNYSNNSQHPQYGKIRDPALDKGDFVFAVGFAPPAPLIAAPAAQSAPAVVQPAAVRPSAPPERPIPADMVRVEGGAFQMGSTNGYDNEKPVHSVTVKSFYMGKYEVTQKEWAEIMGTNPSKFKGDDLPVENVSWYDAIEYCNKRSLKEGLTPAYRGSGDSITCNFSATGYRLPTEAEWEYAAKGGDKDYLTLSYSGSNNADAVGWHTDNSGGRTHPVGTKLPNDLGLFDMSGNVWEWCWDWYGDYPASARTDPAGPASGALRVLRGGSWNIYAQYLRSAFRGYNTPSLRDSYGGFRLVRP